MNTYILQGFKDQLIKEAINRTEGDPLNAKSTAKGPGKTKQLLSRAKGIAKRNPLAVATLAAGGMIGGGLAVGGR